jgi:hypothetical protein
MLHGAAATEPSFAAPIQKQKDPRRNFRDVSVLCAVYEWPRATTATGVCLSHRVCSESSGPISCESNRCKWSPSYHHHYRVIIVILWLIRPTNLFSLIHYWIKNYTDSQWDSLNWGSARSKALSTLNNTNAKTKRTSIYGLSGSPTHDARLWAGEDI